jgi:hypothetical protein
MNHRKLKICFFFLALLALTGCTKNIDVPADQYGIVIRFGEIIKTVEGPKKIDNAYIFDVVRYIRKKDQISLGKGKYTIPYNVTDPIKYYLMCEGNNSRFLFIVEKEIANRAVNGYSVNSRKTIIKIMEDMKLPIEIEKNA